MLPRAADAKDGKPRGLDEIADTLKTHVHNKSLLVHDKFTSTTYAVRKLGYKAAPPVSHVSGYRDARTGFHTNDAESENARLKKWSRSRYGQLYLTDNEMDEYAFTST